MGGSLESRAREPKRVAKPRGNGARASPRLSRFSPHFTRSCTTRFGPAFPPTKTASYAGYVLLILRKAATGNELGAKSLFKLRVQINQIINRSVLSLVLLKANKPNAKYCFNFTCINCNYDFLFSFANWCSRQLKSY